MAYLYFRPRPGTPSLHLDTDELARDYDRISTTRQFEFGKQLVAALNLRTGERVLDVGFQPEQLKRYHARAQAAVQSGWLADYDIVLCAPLSYYELSPKAKDFASYVSYETIADELSNRSDGSPSQNFLRQQYRASFLRTAATRAANRWERVDDPETNRFWSAAYALASSSFPALEMKEPKYSKGTAWITFRPHWMPTQPRQVRVELKGAQGYADLTFGETEARLFF